MSSAVVRRRGWLLAVVVVAVMPVSGGWAPGWAQEQGYEQVLDLAFPVSGPVTYSDDYHANRGGGERRHQATDIFGDKLQHVHAAVGGVIVRITGIDEPMPSWGYQIVIRGDDGRDYGYVHLNNDTPGTDNGLGGPEWAYAPGMRRGVQVERGQWIGYLGDSGNAEDTPPHLHFQIVDPDLDDPRLADPPYAQGRIDPYPSLEAARERGDVPAPPDDPALHIRRLAGPSRVDTAVAMSAEREAPAAAVVVVPSASPAEALIAAPLASAVEAPVLLANATELPSSVAAEVRRLTPSIAYLVGRPEQLSEQVARDLTAAGVGTVTRLTAPDVFALSAVVATELRRRTVEEAGSSDEVYLALGHHADPGRSWPDALSVSALAAHTRSPVLLTRGDRLPAAVAQVLGELRPDRLHVVGGTAAIAEAVAVEAARAAGLEQTERLAGPTRYETSVAVAGAAVAAGLDGEVVWLATGRNFPDALAAGPAAARSRSPLLLVDGQRVGGSAASDEWLGAQSGRASAVMVVGGAAAVSHAVAAAAAARLGLTG